MKLHTLLLFVLLTCFGYSVHADDNIFESNIVLKKDTSSPNIVFNECTDCKDTYPMIMWKGPDGTYNTMFGAHEIKGSTGAEHFHLMERVSCGTAVGDITHCGRVETDIDSDFPTREFRNMDIYINPVNGKGDGALFMESPDGNVWKLTVSNAGVLRIEDENPPAQPVKD